MESKEESKSFEQFCIKSLAPLVRDLHTESVEVAPQRCSCRKTKCLKRYCECFALNKYCDGCLCKNCLNKPLRAARERALKKVLGRSREAFTGAKKCSCSKVACKMKYCTCFHAGIPCTNECKCVGCLNTRVHRI